MVAVNDILEFEYGSGTQSGRRLVRVLKIRDLRKEPVCMETVMRSQHIRRNRYLITARQSDGRIRSFYTDEISLDAKRIGWFHRTILFLMGVRV